MTGTITLFKDSICLETRTYSSFRERIEILDNWKRTHKNYYYHIEPKTGEIITIEPRNTRARILLNKLK